MRAVILYNTSHYVYLLRRNLIQALHQCGVEVTVVAPRDEYTSRVEALGVRYIPLDLAPRNTLPHTEARTIAQLFRILKTTQPDYVLSFTVKCNLYAGLCRKILPFQQIANISGLGEGFDRGGPLNMTVRSLYRLGLQQTFKVFFQNPEDRQLCIRHGLVREAATRLLPGSGVDLTAFAPFPPPAGSTRIFLMFGRLLPLKGFHRFIEAARELREKYGTAGEFWILGGADYARPESVELLEAIKRADSAGIIRYIPPTDNVLPLLKRTDVVVLPSTYNEGVPRSLLEALACAKPVVTTDWKGCRETVVPDQNGYLVPPHEDRPFILALECMLTAPGEKLKEMGLASRRLAETRFDEEVVLNAYLAAMSLTGREQGRPPSLPLQGTA